jgi:gliding motility-associated-like protein
MERCLYNWFCGSLMLFVAVFFVNSSASAQLRINEVSQGASGTKEYVELVVVGNRTCTDSCADIRGWIVDDNSGWLGAGSGQGIATGCMRFANDPNWSCVPYGSIILIYNDGDVNGSITQAPDPSDANNDNVYVIPASSNMMERHPSLPVSPSSLGFVYPSTGFVAGGSWSTMGLANTGDAIIITDPANLGQGYHSLGFGSISNSTNASIYFSTSGGARVYYLSDDQYNTVGSWVVGNVPQDESPGVPNTAANATWINGMLTQVGGTVTTDIYACVNSGNTYFFNNQNLSVTGIYNDTLAAVSGCDSVISLHLQVFQAAVQDQYLYGCDSLVYQGTTYTSSVNLTNTILSSLGCDSAISVMHIVIQNVVPVVTNSSLSGCGAVVYNGNTYTASTLVSDTTLSFAGCDSIYNNVTITIYPENPVDLNLSASGCKEVLVNGTYYYTNGVVEDTLYSVYGCDSVYRHTTVTILTSPGLLSVTPSDTTICPNRTVQLIAAGGTNISWVGFSQQDTINVTPKKTTTYTAVALANNGCIDTAYAKVTVEDFEIVLSSNEPKLIKGETLYLITSGNFPYVVNGWEPAALFTDQQSVNQVLIADVTRKYTVYGESIGAGCKDTSTVVVEVDVNPEIFFPNVFTPNGDGLNDYIFPISNKKFTMIAFEIYNRWGNLVYQWNDGDTRGWNGKYKGDPADQGVFVYYMKLALSNDELFEKKGNITLIR